jgi:hypothetical protein
MMPRIITSFSSLVSSLLINSIYLEPYGVVGVLQEEL